MENVNSVFLKVIYKPIDSQSNQIIVRCMYMDQLAESVLC